MELVSSEVGSISLFPGSGDKLIVAEGRSVVCVELDSKLITGTVELPLQGAPSNRVTCLAKAVDASTVVASFANRVFVLSISQVITITKSLNIIGHQITTLALHPYGQQIAAGCQNGNTFIIDVPLLDIRNSFWVGLPGGITFPYGFPLVYAPLPGPCV